MPHSRKDEARRGAPAGFGYSGSRIVQPTTDEDSRFRVIVNGGRQWGSYRLQSVAEKIAGQLRGHGFDARVETGPRVRLLRRFVIDVSVRDHGSMCIGRFHSRSAAERMAVKHRAQGYVARIREVYVRDRSEGGGAEREPTT